MVYSVSYCLSGGLYIMDPSDSIELKAETLTEEEIKHMKSSLSNFFRSKSNIASGGM